jgi:hypothetical protein
MVKILNFLKREVEMAMFKTIEEKARLLFALFIVLLILYQAVPAIINIASNPVYPGRGSYFSSGAGYDTLNIGVMYGIVVNDTAIGADTTTLKNVFAVASHVHTNIDSTWITDNGIAQADLRDNVIGNAECQEIDSTWLTAGSIGTSSIKNGGIFGEDIAAGQVVKYGRRSGGEDAPIYDSLLFAAGSNISIVQSGNTLTFSSSTGGGAFFGIHIPGGTVTTDTMVFLADYGVILREVNPASNQDTIAIKVDTTTLNGLWISPWELEDSLDGYLTSGAVEALIGDSLAEYLTETATRDAIHDSIWRSDPLPPLRSFAIGEGMDDSVGIQWPIKSTWSNWIVKHYNTSLTVDDQMDTIVYSWVLPEEAPDVDSVTFNMLSTDADTNVTGLRVRCFKRTAELDAETALSAALQAFSTATAVATHKTIAGASIGAVSGGNEFSINMCVQLDVAGILYHDEPKVYCSHK